MKKKIMRYLTIVLGAIVAAFAMEEFLVSSVSV